MDFNFNLNALKVSGQIAETPFFLLMSFLINFLFCIKDMSVLYQVFNLQDKSAEKMKVFVILTIISLGKVM